MEATTDLSQPQSGDGDGMIGESTPCPSRACRHCALPLQPGQESFCCTGCATIYKTIHILGLTDFYTYRDARLDISRSAALPRQRAYDWVDHPDIANTVVHSRSDGNSEAAVTLEGIHCIGCLWLLERLPQFLPGVVRSTLSLPTNQLEIVFSPSAISLSAICETLDSLGYPPVLGSASDSTRTRMLSRQAMLRIAVAAFCSLNTMMLATSLYQGWYTGIDARVASVFRCISMIVAIPCVTFSAQPFYRNALNAIRARILHIDVPIALAIALVFSYSSINTLLDRPDVYFDSVTTLVFLLLATRRLQEQALARFRFAIDEAWGLIPPTTTVRGLHGEAVRETASVVTGEIVLVPPHERIPVDGVVVQGISTVDRSIVTGEAFPATVSAGALVEAGILNGDGTLEVQAVRAARQSHLLEAVRNARRSVAERQGYVPLWAQRASTFFVLGTLTLGLMTMLLWWGAGPGKAIDNTLSLFIVACPCALGLATPLAFTMSIGRASRLGIYIRQERALDLLRSIKAVVFDKTGTLTTGSFKVTTSWLAPTVSEQQAIDSAHALGSATPTHPISRCFATLPGSSDTIVHEVQQVPGMGICGIDGNGMPVKLGNMRWLGEGFPPDVIAQHHDATLVGLTINGEAAALFTLTDEVRPEARDCIQTLEQRGIAVYILSGDRRGPVQRVGNLLGIPDNCLFAEQLPEDKRACIAALGEGVLYVGDGVNDTGAMAEAAASIGVHGGLQALQEVADVWIPSGGLSRITVLLDGGAAIWRTITWCLLASICFNSSGALLAMGGLINPFIAAVLMPLSSATVLIITLLSGAFRSGNSGCSRQDNKKQRHADEGL